MTDNGCREEKKLGLSLLSGMVAGKLAVAFGTWSFLNNSQRQKTIAQLKGGLRVLISKL